MKTEEQIKIELTRLKKLREQKFDEGHDVIGITGAIMKLEWVLKN